MGFLYKFEARIYGHLTPITISASFRMCLHRFLYQKKFNLPIFY